MFITVARQASTVALRAVFYICLFIFVVGAQVGVTTGLRAAGLGGGLSLMAASAAVLAIVGAAVWLANGISRLRQEALARARRRLNLPAGACCLLWRAGEASDMPWRPVRPLKVAYPDIARKSGVEGIAIVDFEIGANGAARSIHCVDSWPTQAFYEAAAASLRQAAFEPKEGRTLRFGESYRLPFVFRIRGATRHEAPQSRGFWRKLQRS